MQQIDQLGVLIGISLKTMGVTVISPIFWLTIWFTYRYYLQYEWDKASAGYLALASSLEGLVAGFFAIYLTTVFGLSIQPGIALYLMGPMAMLLSLLRPRYLCLSYGAGVMLVLCTLFGISADGVGICGLVGILHLAEGLLVLFVGGQHTVALYGRSKGRVITESGICRFWPVPVGILVALQGVEGNWLNMPQWWPLLEMKNDMSYRALGLIPLAVSLGYSDLSGAQNDVKKRRICKGGLIILYAIILLGLCIIAVKSYVGEWIAVFWMVLGHEVIIVSADLFTKN